MSRVKYRKCYVRKCGGKWSAKETWVHHNIPKNDGTSIVYHKGKGDLIIDCNINVAIMYFKCSKSCLDFAINNF